MHPTKEPGVNCTELTPVPSSDWSLPTTATNEVVLIPGAGLAILLILTEMLLMKVGTVVKLLKIMRLEAVVREGVILYVARLVVRENEVKVAAEREELY